MQEYEKYILVIRRVFPEFSTLSDVDLLHRTISNYNENTHSGFNVHKYILDSIVATGDYQQFKYNKCLKLSTPYYRILFDTMNVTPYCIDQATVYITDETLRITIAMCDGFENFVSILKIPETK